MVPLLDPDQPEHEFMVFDQTTAAMLRAIKRHYTRDAAVQAMDALEPILGKAWKGRIIFGLMTDRYSKGSSITIRKNPVKPNRKINAIKALRGLTNLGLTEAKKAVEDSEVRRVTMDVNLQNIDPMNYEAWNHEINVLVGEITASGYDVEVL